MKSYPIWCVVNAPDYASSKHFGAKDYTSTDINIGSSATNSFDFVKTEVIKTEFLQEDEVNGVIKTRLCYEFEFRVDGVCVKKAWYDTKSKKLVMCKMEVDAELKAQWKQVK